MAGREYSIEVIYSNPDKDTVNIMTLVTRRHSGWRLEDFNSNRKQDLIIPHSTLVIFVLFGSRLSNVRFF